jgi:integrase
MKKLAETHHLQKRGAAWYYRRRVPTHLRRAFGVLIQHSLGTTSKKTAIKTREILDVEWSKKFDAAEAAQRPSARHAVETSLIQKTVLTEAEAVERVRAYVERDDERHRKDALAADPLDLEERSEWEKELEIELAIARGRARDYDLEEFISRQRESIFPRSEVAVDEETNAAVYDMVQRAEIELARRRLARERNDHRHSHFDRLFDPKLPPAVTVQELAEQYLELKREEGEAHGLARKTLDKQHANLKLVREILGPETMVRDLTWDACRRFCSVLAQVPPNRTKFYPGQSLDEAIAGAKQDGRSGLSAVTQQEYLSTLKELLALAVKKDLMRVNYAEDLRPLKIDDLSPEEKRRPFEIDQLRVLFASAYYRKCADAGDVPYRQADKYWRYWFPLVSLFTGMRPKEVLQMHVGDLKHTDEGTWYLHIVATTDEADVAAPEHKKTIKTLTSKRKIPVHPELIRLGFLAFVDEQKKASGSPLLFRGLTRNQYGDPAAYALKRFREAYLKVMDLKPRQSAYSFRHTWRDATRRIGAPAEFLRAVGGWSDGKTTADVYGSKDLPDLYAKEMARIAFEGLDLSHLYPKPLPD